MGPRCAKGAGSLSDRVYLRPHTGAIGVGKSPMENWTASQGLKTCRLVLLKIGNSPKIAAPGTSRALLMFIKSS